jgi:hypothetical protein
MLRRGTAFDGRLGLNTRTRVFTLGLTQTLILVPRNSGVPLGALFGRSLDVRGAHETAHQNRKTDQETCNTPPLRRGLRLCQWRFTSGLI